MSTHDHVSQNEKAAKPKGERLNLSPDLNASPSLLQRAQSIPASLTAKDVKQLQRTIGNRATVGLLSRSVPIQTKLTLGPAQDQYEREADQVAAQVVRKIDSDALQREEDEEEIQTKPLTVQRAEDDEIQTKSLTIQREEDAIQTKPLAASISPIQRATTTLRRTFIIQRQLPTADETLQAKYEHGPEGGEVDPSVTTQIQAARGGGRSLDDGVRGSMEGGFGADFSNVRVHTDAKADSLNRSLNARAFTVGSDVFFRSGEYNPGSSGGKKLLAHELTHTIQQGAAQAQRAFEKPVVADIDESAKETQP